MVLTTMASDFYSGVIHHEAFNPILCLRGVPDLCGGGAAWAASSFAVVPGNWVVTSEVNGQAGRGMGIEVREGVLVMTVYNYKASGDATFHLTAGNMSGNDFTGQLFSYRGGRSLGGPARSAALEGSAGEVRIRFTSATTGVIQFPNEGAVPISHFTFDGIPAGRFTRADAYEDWFVTELDGTNQPVSSNVLVTGRTRPAICSHLQASKAVPWTTVWRAVW
ncbi:hypothetical protein [Diaphorobacter aerolatus]|uniref:Uncharacterized protein n=1 Tax=Diaphorobacter aerolatus TaxID=1288495 RepID=A0A7H0GFQ7_9BURK|nr:hypothetical protein [Diaphorobacter aerolatus]QNP47123.1 hypothetical protein H9K75_11860 [Diaphorobacter aerolatus]